MIVCELYEFEREIRERERLKTGEGVCHSLQKASSHARIGHLGERQRSDVSASAFRGHASKVGALGICEREREREREREMEMELQQSVRRDGMHVGNTEAQISVNLLSPSPDSSSSCSSSPQSSPDHSTTSATNSPNLSPSLQADQQSYVINLSDPAPVGSSARPPQRFLKAESMKSLQESIPHKLKLKKLHKSDKGFQKEATSHKKQGRRLSKELYMIVSMYALLQGALFAAVAQTSVFNCEDLWGPVCIAGMVTLGTLVSALDKLRRMGQEKEEVKMSQRRQSAVYDKIAILQWKGSACSIEDLEPEHDDVQESGSGFVYSPHGLLVLAFLAGFSGLIIASCYQMLCRSCHCQH